MKKLIETLVSAIVGADAAIVAIWFDLSDRAVLFFFTIVTVGLCLFFDVFEDDYQEPESEREEHAAHTSGTHDLRHAA